MSFWWSFITLLHRRIRWSKMKILHNDTCYVTYPLITQTYFFENGIKVDVRLRSFYIIMLMQEKDKLKGWFLGFIITVTCATPSRPSNITINITVKIPSVKPIYLYPPDGTVPAIILGGLFISPTSKTNLFRDLLVNNFPTFYNQRRQGFINHPITTFGCVNNKPLVVNWNWIFFENHPKI